MISLVQVEKFGPTDKLNALTSDSFTLSNAATLANSFSVLGYTLNNTPSGRPEYGLIGDALTGTTTLSLSRVVAQSTAISCCGYVAEFSSGIIVERGTASLAAGASIDVTLSSITDISKAFRVVRFIASGTVWGGQHGILSYLWNDGGTLKLRLENNASVTSGTAYYQVVQMDNCSVQRGSTSMTSSETTPGTPPSISAVDLGKSFLNFDFKSPNPTTANNIAAICLNGYFGSTTSLTFERSASDTTAITDIRWEVVSFTNGVSVQEVKHTFSATQNSANKTITAVTGTGNTLVMGACRQNFGSTTANTDTMGECCFQFNLTTTTNVTVARQSNQDAFAASVTCYVIDFGVPENRTGTAAQTLEFFSQAASGTFTAPGGGSITGTAAQELNFLTQAASGTNEPEYTGTAAQELNFLTQAASGTNEPEYTGSAAQELNFFTQALAGTFEVESEGTIVQELNFLTQALSGVNEPEYTGPIAQELNFLTQSLTGISEPEFTGSAAQELNFLTQALSGYFREFRDGDIAQELNFLTQALNGTNEPEYTGSIAHELNFLTQNLSGTSEGPVQDGAIIQVLNFIVQDLDGTFEPEPLVGAIEQEADDQTQAASLELIVEGALIQEADSSTNSLLGELTVEGAILQETDDPDQDGLGEVISGIIINQENDDCEQVGHTELLVSGVIHQENQDSEQEGHITIIAAPVSGVIFQELEPSVNQGRIVIQIPGGDGLEVNIFAPNFNETQLIAVSDSSGGVAIEIGQGEKIFIENTGLARCYFAIGDSSVSATAPTEEEAGDIPLAPDRPYIVDSYYTNNSTKTKYIAVVCAEGESTTIEVFTARR